MFGSLNTRSNSIIVFHGGRPNVGTSHTRPFVLDSVTCARGDKTTYVTVLTNLYVCKVSISVLPHYL
jgi:hypothetical protein